MIAAPASSIIAAWDDHEVDNNWSYDTAGMEETVQSALAEFLGKGLLDVLDGRIVVHHHCHRADDIMTVLRLRDEFGFKVGQRPGEAQGKAWRHPPQHVGQRFFKLPLGHQNEAAHLFPPQGKDSRLESSYLRAYYSLVNRTNLVRDGVHAP